MATTCLYTTCLYTTCLYKTEEMVGDYRTLVAIWSVPKWFNFLPNYLIIANHNTSGFSLSVLNLIKDYLVNKEERT